MAGFKRVLNELKDLGTAQNIKIYKRHGAMEPLYGVSFADLGKMTKKYKQQTELARQLWASKNTDARILACMIADPSEMTTTELDSWVKEVNYTGLAGFIGGLTSRSKFNLSKINKWSKSRKEFVIDCGFSTLSNTLKSNPEQINDSFCLEMLARIEKEIHSSPNFSKSAMNRALISIGVYKPKLTAKAMQAARRIGKVEVDHGETSCKTPDALFHIKKSIFR